MSREDYEQSEASWIDEEFSRGPGDPDTHGYPGEPQEITKPERKLNHASTSELDLSEIPF